MSALHFFRLSGFLGYVVSFLGSQNRVRDPKEGHGKIIEMKSLFNQDRFIKYY